MAQWLMKIDDFLSKRLVILNVRLTLSRPRFFTKKTAFFTVKAVFSVLCCQIPPNFATKAFSYTLAKIRPLAGKSQGFP